MIHSMPLTLDQEEEEVLMGSQPIGAQITWYWVVPIEESQGVHTKQTNWSTRYGTDGQGKPVLNSQNSAFELWHLNSWNLNQGAPISCLKCSKINNQGAARSPRLLQKLSDLVTGMSWKFLYFSSAKYSRTHKTSMGMSRVN